MKKQFTGSCYFKGIDHQVTVGDIFEMHCTWPVTALLSPPFRWELTIVPSTTDSSPTTIQPHSVPLSDTYHLAILKTVKIEKDQGTFKVTSYQPGHHQAVLRFISATDSINFSTLEWNVASVIPKEKAQTIQPYPPYGPWITPLPIWYWPMGIALVFALIIFIVVRLKTFFKRRTWIANIYLRRQDRNSFSHFTNELILLERVLDKIQPVHFMQKLKKIFSNFLEEEFLVPVENNPLKLTIRMLKRNHPDLYKAHHRHLSQFFIELANIESGTLVNKKDYEQLLNMGRELGIKLFLLAREQQGNK